MSQDEREEPKRGFRVEDRRRFSESGEARHEPAEAAPEPPRADTTDAAAAPHAPAQSTASSPPSHDHADVEINFSTFVISLSTQALAHLGEIPNPLDNQMLVDLGAARELIDILGILQQKTTGNLDPAEAGLLENLLYDLRLRYVERTRSK